jgi:hypothetical protein
METSTRIIDYCLKCSIEGINIKVTLSGKTLRLDTPYRPLDGQLISPQSDGTQQKD